MNADLIILFGSQAAGTSRYDSDIDPAVISRDFGKDRFEEGSRLNYLASSINHRIEAVPVGLDEYLAKNSISPILQEITTKGIPLL
ncbi:MAG TPA: nucleotidyltransferase domain-containing protein [Spirochaetota bacterium]|nr:nucleotidyltransferase domain-containing protein [Spirochaetota bacterium]